MTDPTRAPDRRRFLRTAAAAGAAAAFAPAAPAADTGRLHHSIAFWCFNSAGDKWDAEKTCQVAKSLGCPSVELIEPEHWGVVKKYGLVCALALNGMPGAPFAKGYNTARYHDEVVTRTKPRIHRC